MNKLFESKYGKGKLEYKFLQFKVTCESVSLNIIVCCLTIFVKGIQLVDYLLKVLKK